MNSVPSPINDEDLQAYVDGRLSRQQRTDFERAMADQPEVAERVAAYSQQRDALRTALGEKFNEAVPEHLRVDHIAGVLAGKRPGRAPAIAAAVAWLVIGGTAGSVGTTVFSSLSSPPVADETLLAARPMADALIAHRVFTADLKHPIEVGANERTHLQMWLSKRVGRELKAPDLSASGYELLGGRLVSASSGPAALLMYQNNLGARMTIYVRSSSDRDEAPVRMINDQGLRAAYWFHDGYGFAVSAEDKRETVLRAAEAAQRQLRI